MTPPADNSSARSPGTVLAYTRNWDLFTDWCAVTVRSALPADPATVVAFLQDCPAAVGTQRRRVTAIDHQHADMGHRKPGESEVVRAVLARPPATPPDNTAAVEAVLRGLPSHGWTRGMFGRRDRCLLVLSQLAGVPYKDLATLTVGGVTLVEGTATIRSGARTWVLHPADNPLLCGPCAVVRWLRILDLVVTKPSNRAIARVLKKAASVTERSPHLCRSTREVSAFTLGVPLLPPIDQWGYVPFPVQRLTPHSLSRRVRDLVAGDLGAHRDLPVDTDDDTATQQPAPVPVPVVDRKVYSREDSQRAWVRRRADLDDLAGVEDLLDQIDARAKELAQRTAAILEEQTAN
jgi:hypothetical protein